ncbi:MAG TPA: transketolase family protein, partial [Planctomycetaceae bacterium]|nr:transketolase family protein [Planctomycetaceae bacterium]
AMLRRRGPTYLRLGRAAVPEIYPNGCDFRIGQAIQLRDGSDATIIANGLMVAVALDAAKLLADQGIQVRVLDMHTVKPIDRDAVAQAARETGAIVVAEEHAPYGGLGSVVATTVAQTVPVPVELVNIGDRYAESGDPDGLLQKYGLSAEAIVKAVRSVRRT